MKNKFSFLNFESERNLFNISVFLAVTFILLHIISYNRESFGVIKGYAPYEFGFNMLFFLPTLLFVSIGTLVIGLKIKAKWHTYKDVKLKWYTIILISPTILFLSFIFLRILLLVVTSIISEIF
ncbi:hypothetical protein [Chryseobacterium sp. FH1]|uniref:hypothetical protein n=1 Tax=Chryseobacterium sp. FH1 TaxID=1233951 RepID=UPI0004E401B9|nr:hypothetical protein [Chryseobacterium sp. FH1]KFC19944.1 hypothetical protein IO90_12020 [Chryseobacterium sp. FH1]